MLARHTLPRCAALTSAFRRIEIGKKSNRTIQWANVECNIEEANSESTEHRAEIYKQ